MNKKRLIVLSSPSGGGKSTVARHLLSKFPQLRFAVSATTRNMRPKETDGKDYYFISKEDFHAKIQANEFVEYEEIFGNFYGTPKSEVEKAFAEKRCLLFDIDVKGALSIRKAYPEDSLLIFLSPVTIYQLEQRLRKRSTETDEQIRIRLARASMEIKLAKDFDCIIVNDALENTLAKTENLLLENLPIDEE